MFIQEDTYVRRAFLAFLALFLCATLVVPWLGAPDGAPDWLGAQTTLLRLLLTAAGAGLGVSLYLLAGSRTALVAGVVFITWLMLNGLGFVRLLPGAVNPEQLPVPDRMVCMAVLAAVQLLLLDVMLGAGGVHARRVVAALSVLGVCGGLVAGLAGVAALNASGASGVPGAARIGTRLGLAVGALVITLAVARRNPRMGDGVSAGLLVMVALLAVGGAAAALLRPGAAALSVVTETELFALAALPFGFAVDGVHAIRRVHLYASGQTDETMRDALTGLANRRVLNLAAPVMFRECQKEGKPLSVLMLDIDHFKMVNDLHGHSAGDAVLRQFAAVIQSQVRSSDMTARYGGEEFVVVLAGAPLAPAMRLAERIRAAVQGAVMEHDKGHLAVTVSVGVSTAFPGEVDDLDAVIRAADRNLYRAKRAGRNCVMTDPLGGEKGE